MTRSLSIVAAQYAPLEIGAPFARFADQARQVAIGTPGVQMLVFPELHLFHSPETGLEQMNAALGRAAQPIDGPLDAQFAALAAELGVWLVPGSLCERGPKGELFNTTVVYSPAGLREAAYRKVFPWRPSEPYDPGDRFVTFDIPDVGRVGLTICYDAWFPEVARQLTWDGAEMILNLVKTTTVDREHELVLARANAIVNQVFLVSVNCAGPVGMGQSLVVGPEGEVREQVTEASPALLKDLIDFDHVRLVRERGTCGVNRMWSQFRPADAPIALPIYGGRIDPSQWRPRVAGTEETR